VHEYVILDVFTDVPLEGNQLAVFTEGETVPSRLMQRTARELNLSETVFLLPGDGDADAELRIFTPVSELPFAGHPTLGSAFVVGERSGSEHVRLRTRAGVVPVSLTREEGEIVFGEMEQPVPVPEPYERAEELLAALGVSRSELPVLAYKNGPLQVMVTLADVATVAALAPDSGALLGLGPLGVSCFALGPEPGAVKTRMFAPGLGVAEDPATGSAAGPLAVHLASHGWTAFGQELRIRQGEEVARPSLLLARAEGAPGRVERVLVGGSAVLVARGEYRLA
jgi:trans-2,3-dihydro-3-hydroxyanthranilate isomerase